MNTSEKSETEKSVNPINSVENFLNSLPSAEEIEAQIAKCDEEKKKLKSLLKVVKGQ